MVLSLPNEHCIVWNACCMQRVNWKTLLCFEMTCRPRRCMPGWSVIPKFSQLFRLKPCQYLVPLFPNNREWFHSSLLQRLLLKFSFKFRVCCFLLSQILLHFQLVGLLSNFASLFTFYLSEQFSFNTNCPNSVLPGDWLIVWFYSIYKKSEILAYANLNWRFLSNVLWFCPNLELPDDWFFVIVLIF